MYSGAEDERREVTLMTDHQKQDEVEGIQAPCIPVRGTREEQLLALLSTKDKRRCSEYMRRVFGCGGRAKRSYFLYCPPKTREGVANTCAVYAGAGDARRQATFFTDTQSLKPNTVKSRLSG